MGVSSNNNLYNELNINISLLFGGTPAATLFSDGLGLDLCEYLFLIEIHNFWDLPFQLFDVYFLSLLNY